MDHEAELWREVYAIEYAYTRSESGESITNSTTLACVAANAAAQKYREWAKYREPRT